MSGRLAVALALAVLLSPATIAVAGARGDLAATPAAERPSLPGRRLLLQSVVARLPSGPLTIRLERVGLVPTAVLRRGAVAGPMFVVVETGEVVARSDMPAVRSPASAGSANESVGPGTDMVLGPGDRVSLGDAATLDLRNDGDAEAAILVASIEPATGEARSGGSGQGNVGASPGVIVRPLGQGVVAEVGEPVLVTLERFALAAGTGLPAYPGPVMLAVEAGAFATRLGDGTVGVSRAGAVARPQPAGARFEVRAGDALVFPDGAAATPALAGDGGLTVLRFGFLPIPTTATPTPATVFAEGTVVAAAVPGLRVRAAPSTTAAIVAELAAGEPIAIVGPPVEAEGRRWYPVVVGATGVTGFVAAEFLTPA